MLVSLVNYILICCEQSVRYVSIAILVCNDILIYDEQSVHYVTIAVLVCESDFDLW